VDTLIAKQIKILRHCPLEKGLVKAAEDIMNTEATGQTKTEDAGYESSNGQGIRKIYIVGNIK